MCWKQLKFSLFIVAQILSLMISCQAFSLDEQTDSKSKLSKEFRKHKGMLLTIDSLLESYKAGTQSVATPIKALFYSYTQSDTLHNDFRDLAVAKIFTAAANSKISLINCNECMSYQSYVENDEFIIKKGIPEDKRLKEVLLENKTKYYAKVHVNEAGREMSLIFTVYDFDNKEVVFSKEYKTDIQVIKEQTLFFSAEGSVIVLNGQKDRPSSLFGAQFALGQFLRNIGSFGVHVGSFLDGKGNFLVSGGLYFAPNFNAIFNAPWKWGSIEGILKTGATISIEHSSNLHIGAGGKLKLGSLFYVSTEARFFINLKKSEQKVEKDVLDFGGNVPVAFIIGVGIDVN